jgi:hypothetical protein
MSDLYELNGHPVLDPDVKILMDAYRELSALLDPIRAAAWDEGYACGTCAGCMEPTPPNPYRGPA